MQIDDDAVQDIQALLQGVRDEIESLHDTYLKARSVRQALCAKWVPIYRLYSHGASHPWA